MLSLAWRMVDLGVFDRSFLRRQSSARTLRTVSLAAHRGIITDRNGQPLAISTPVDSIWVNPQLLVATRKQVLQLAKLLKLDVRSLTKRLSKKGGREFVYLKRHVSPSVSEKVKAFDMVGVFKQREYRRFYPEAEVTSHVIGFTNIDDRGQEGLELAFDRWLRGVPGKKRVIKDRLGHSIADVAVLAEPKQGHDLTLSLDRRIQYLAYRELQSTLLHSHAKSGSVVVLDVQTGEVLAMVNQPAFNPNQRSAGHTERYRNRAVTDVFEPGSTMKAFSVASALASGHYAPYTKVDTRPGRWIVDGKVIRDENFNHGVITVSQVLQKSSNVGVAKMTLALPPEHFINLLRRVGFGERTASGFPGEVSGSIVEHHPWRKFELATLAFGYGIAITPLQLASAYAVIAANGVKRPVTLLRRKEQPAGERVMSSKVATQMLRMLTDVLKTGGTGIHAQVPGYQIAGKTGTARIAGKHGYDEPRYVASFAGIAPASNPRLVVVVVIKEPQQQYYSGLVAAPIFSRIMSGALRVMNVPPDEIVASYTNPHKGRGST